MSKIYWLFVIALSALAIWGTEKALADTTTIFAPDGTITICTTSKDMIICT